MKALFSLETHAWKQREAIGLAPNYFFFFLAFFFMRFLLGTISLI